MFDVRIKLQAIVSLALLSVAGPDFYLEANKKPTNIPRSIGTQFAPWLSQGE